jgi:biopolymer transport protein ExbB/TolQ
MKKLLVLLGCVAWLMLIFGASMWPWLLWLFLVVLQMVNRFWLSPGWVKKGPELRDAQERAIFLDWPPEAMSKDEAHSERRLFQKMPGRPNEAVSAYLRNVLEADEMENLLNQRYGLPCDATQAINSSRKIARLNRADRDDEVAEEW